MRSDLLVLAAFFLAGCYAPAPANGAWTCHASPNECPSGYSCTADHTCWKNGSDASTTTDGGVSCAGSMAPLCEDFESGIINMSTWSTLLMHGEVSVDGEHVHRGQFALHAHSDATTTNPSDATAMITTQQVFPALQTAFFVRVFLYIPSPGSMAETLLLAARDNSGANLGVQTGDVTLFEYGMTPDLAQVSATEMPIGTWVCLEWNVNGGSTQTWLNDTALADLSSSGMTPGPVRMLDLGIDFSDTDAQGQTDLWIDDIIVDDAQIGCAR